jgi:hypothetical protein
MARLTAADLQETMDKAIFKEAQKLIKGIKNPHTGKTLTMGYELTRIDAETGEPLEAPRLLTGHAAETAFLFLAERKRKQQVSVVDGICRVRPQENNGSVNLSLGKLSKGSSWHEAWGCPADVLHMQNITATVQTELNMSGLACRWPSGSSSLCKPSPSTAQHSTQCSRRTAQSRMILGSMLSWQQLMRMLLMQQQQQLLLTLLAVRRWLSHPARKQRLGSRRVL